MSGMRMGFCRAGMVAFVAATLLVPSFTWAYRAGNGAHTLFQANNSGGGFWSYTVNNKQYRLIVSTGSPAALSFACQDPLKCPQNANSTITKGGWLWNWGFTDRTAPEITPPADLTLEQANLGGTTLSFQDARLRPLVNDNRDPNPTVRVAIAGLLVLDPLEQAAGGRLIDQVGQVTFPLGQTQVVYTATDRQNNRSTARMNVKIVDTTPPKLTVPAKIVVEAESPQGTAVRLPNPDLLSDLCDASPDVVVENLPPNGVFPLYDANGQPGAEWTVMYRATDNSGNVVTAQLVVKVVDTTPPTIALQQNQITLEQAERCGSRLDNIPGAVVADRATPQNQLLVRITRNNELLAPNHCFPLGNSTITYAVSDLSGNTASAVLSLIVRDTIKPVVREISAPERIYHNRARDYVVSISDICDANPGVVVQRVDRPVVRDPQQPEFYTAVYANDGLYDVSWTATDASGNRTVTQNRRFGIDTRPPVATYQGISQAGVDPLDQYTYPAFFKGEKIDTVVSGSDDPAAQGTYSGYAQISAIVDPEAGARSVVLFQRTYDATVGTDPAQGPVSVKNLQCDNAEYCDKFARFQPGLLGAGPHVLAIRSVDRAGNVKTQNYYFNIFNLRIALEQAHSQIRRLLLLPETPAAAKEILQGDLTLIGYNPQAAVNPDESHTAAYFADVQWERDAPYDERSFLEIGNVVLYLVTLLKDLSRVNDNWVDTSQMLKNLSTGAIAEVELLYDWTAQEVGDIDREVGAARAYLDQAVADQQAGRYQSAMLQLGHAIFRLQNAYAPAAADDLDSIVSLGRRLYREMEAYIRTSGINGRDAMVAALDSFRPALFYIEQFGDNMATDQWIKLMLHLSDTSQALADAQLEFTWVRFWQWELTYLVKFNVDIVRQMACVDYNTALGLVAPTCPDNSGYDLLHEGQCRYKYGVAYLATRDVDNALDVYIGSRCLIETIFEEIYNEPDQDGIRRYPGISISPDCPRRNELFLYEYTLLPGDQNGDGIQDYSCTLL